MADIVDRLLDDPCTTLSDSDADALRKVDPGVLKRLILGIKTQEVPVANQGEDAEEGDTQIAEMQEALKATQDHIKELLDTEAELRSVLKDFGIQTTPVVDRTVAVSNQKSAPKVADLTPELVTEWVRKSTTPWAMTLREGLSALRLSREKCISVIVNNTSEYTAQDLQRMPLYDLDKLARVLESRSQQTPQDALFNWEGRALADQTINQTPVLRGGTTLDLPSTGIGNPPTRY